MGDETKTGATAPMGTTDPASAPLLQGMAGGRARGSGVGRFIIIDELGAGGMGVVYAGYDPELDRKVAIKLVRRANKASAVALHSRLVREARALAKLAHPNVVGVYDVGVADDDIYIAMEYVEGSTLREWLEAEERSAEEILAVFVQAGRGLAAGHTAGVVHRDFKPDNVVVGHDRRVRVIDFGVAALAGELDDEPELHPASPSSPRLTVTGTIIGTPRYMAPEQHRGDRVTLAADQFAFCVALYEALAGEAPFEGKSQREIASAIDDGPPELPSTMPAQVGRAVLRGLAVDPADRFLSMDELLAELELEPPRSATRGLVTAAIMVVGIAALLLVALRSSERRAGPSCAVDPSQLAGVWDADRRAVVQRAFQTQKRAYVAEVFERTAAGLDHYTRDWLRMRADTCAATHKRGEQSSALLDLRMHCLDGLRTEVSALVAALADKPTTAVIAKAPYAVGKLRAIDTCADVDALRIAVPLPGDPEIRKKIERVTSRIARVEAMHRVGRSKDALALAKTAADEAAALEYDPLHGRGLSILGAIQGAIGDYEASEASLREAAVVAARAKADRLAAQSLTTAVAIVGYMQRDSARASSLATAAKVAIARAGDDADLHAQLANIQGLVLLVSNKFEQALEAFRRSRELYTQSVGPTATSTSNAVGNEGTALSAMGRFTEAVSVLEQALKIQQQALGNSHPKLVGTLNALAGARAGLGQHDAALELYRRAVKLLENVYGDDHPTVASVLTNLASALEATDTEAARAEALALVQRALKIRTKAFGPKHPRTAETIGVIGGVLYGQNRFAEARVHYDKALRLLEGALGPTHPRVGFVLNSMGIMLNRQRDHKGALKACQRAYEIDKASIGDKNPDISYSEACVALALVGLARYRAALPYAKHAYTLVGPASNRKTAPGHLANIEFALARARWGANKRVGLAEIRALAQSAVKRYQQVNDPRATTAAKWLESLPKPE